MPGPATLAALFPLCIAAYLCGYGTGHAWWRGRASALPRPFARVTVSLLVTSVVSLVLVVLEVFSLPRLVAICGVVSLVGYLLVGRVRHLETVAAGRAARGGLLVFVAAFSLYWPPFEAHLAASDASTYLAAGVQLVREHKLTKTDDLGPLVPPLARGAMFFSTLGLPWKPPYSRVHGGLVIESLGAKEASPSFFPLPSMWAAIFSDALGSRYGGGYVALFSAAAVWAMWLLARARLGGFGALTITALVAANAASYWAGRMPLSESLAWFFALAGLVALDAYEDDGFAADARLAGALLGATALVRVEYAPFVVAALLARVALRATLTSRPLGVGFVAALGIMLGATALQATLVPGAYTAPLEDVAHGLRWITARARLDTPWTALAACVTAVALYGVAAWRLGVVRATAAAGVAAFLGVYVRFSPDPGVMRTLLWLAAYLGWATIALAGVGAVRAWRGRFAQPADAFLVVLFVVFTVCLLYDPHVYPAMPWASRRFVPVVIPLGLLFAGMVCTVVWRRSVVAGLLAWALTIGSVVSPATQVWNRDFFEGTYDQLNELVGLLPAEGSVLLENDLVTIMIGPPLWLAYGRNSLPVSLANENGRQTIAGMTRILRENGKGPVFLIRPTLLPKEEPIPFTVSRRIADYTLQLRLPNETGAPPPSRVEKYTMSIAVHRLDPVDFPPPK
jgi:hypothetical protein